MPRLILQVGPPKTPFSYRLIDRSGHVTSLLAVSVYAFVDLRYVVRPKYHRERGLQKAILDTGAFLNIVPENVWKFFDLRTIDWLSLDPASPPVLNSVTIG